MNARRGWVVPGVAAAWIALWFGLLEQVTPGGETPAGPIVHDSANYLRMVEFGPTAAIAPFCYRVGQPLLAHALPLPPRAALIATSLAALWLALVLWWHRARALGFSVEALAFAAAATASTQGWAGLFNDPHRTDAAGHLVHTGAWLAWLDGAVPAALALAVVGPLFREQIAALWLLFAVRGRFALAGALVLVSAGSLLAVRAWPGMPPVPELAETYRAVQAIKGWGRIFGDAFAAFHGLWLVAGLGLVVMPPAQRRAVVPPLVISLVVGAGLCAIALNTVRLLSFALPFVALAWAAFADALRARERRALQGLAAVLLVGGLLWFPTRLWGTSPKALQYVLGGAVGVAALWLWHRRARSETVAPSAP